MNKWIRRTAGTVGIAGGALLLGTAAHADNPGIADPQSLHDLTDTASVDGGVGGLGVSVDTPGQRDTIGVLPDGGGPIRSGTNNGELGAVVHAPTSDGQPRDVFANGRTPDIFQALPITDVVPMDGLGLPNSGAASGLTGGPRTLPSRESLGLPETNGIPVRNLPIGTSAAGDTLRGGDSLARDGLAGNGLGIPLGNRLPLGAAQGLATQGQPLGGQALGGGLGGGLPLLGSGAADTTSGGGRAATTPTAGHTSGSAQGSTQGSALAGRSQGAPMLSDDAVHVLPPSESAGLHRAEASLRGGFGPNLRGGWAGWAGRHRAEAGLPSAGGLPVVGGVLQGGTLPTRANVNTLPGAPAVPVHDLLAPGTSATGASAGNALNSATGTVGSATGSLTQAAGGGSESLPLDAVGGSGLPVGGLPVGGGGGLPVGGGGLPVVGGLTSPGGTQGMPLPDTAGVPVVGGIADGLTGGKHRAQYTPRHSG